MVPVCYDGGRKNKQRRNMATRYEYKVTVSHYTSFYDEDVTDNFGEPIANPTEEDREQFAQSNWGGSFDTDFDTESVELYDSEDED
jgi:hypothetical protein